ncbi:von Willebrand factor type A domain-containing protein [Mesorhizobium sp. YR577]|uniref:YfbK domain-containing protein n=1 Tax=Mesorhizobium sp. YR577 TaxID=1884373 RepID=UPI0008F297C4|nr:von Willebrand factor type A domain-containing protein [Mesorhizobium sp. YR577]SFT76651.1 Ca-activated chloride channel family protein [Mesorhizobium sp. YR577]
MVDDNELNRLRDSAVPKPSAEARARALNAAFEAFDEKKTSPATQGSQPSLRLTDRIHKLWSEMMQKKLYAAPALAGLVALPVAGYMTFQLVENSPFDFGTERKVSEPRERVEQPATVQQAPVEAEQDKDEALAKPATPQREPALSASEAQPQAAGGSAPPSPTVLSRSKAVVSNQNAADSTTLMAEPQAIMPTPADVYAPAEASNDRVQQFDTNPIHSAKENPVSTFSIDVDTASYSFVRRSLKEGVLPQPDTVRVEEMINYFPYDWAGPDSAATPFNSTVTVMPTPWNENTKLMHIAIKGYDVKPAEQPKANLVFLIDVSGSMNEPDKLPLLQSAFRLLVNRLGPDDTVSIVTYAGEAGTVLEPTSGSDKVKILEAIDRLQPGGSTAGAAGIEEAYRLAQKSFIKDGINRVMLATDGDFNVGQSDDADLKRMVEEKRKSGIFLSVFGFGRGNLNDQMMQTIAQNGNGTAAYIDTLAEAEKVLVQDAGSTLFPIAKDVKIQVEFNPEKVSEYRLIGYETRALKREDFNNDRVDAGEIGSGHSVTAVYEITPKGSPAQAVDDLRYGEAKTDNATGVANADEYAFVKIRYKLPDGDVSKLVTTPVTLANEVGSFDDASDDQRFSVAVAAFGQKLRDADQTANFGYDRIREIASAARGADPFGYRSEFLSLVRLAAALGSGGR